MPTCHPSVLLLDLKIKAKRACPVQEWGRRTFRCPPRDTDNIQSQVLLRRLKCQGSCRLGPHGARSRRAGLPARLGRRRGHRDSAFPEPKPPRPHGRAPTRATGPAHAGRQRPPRSSSLRIPARCQPAASPRSGRATARLCLQLPFPSRAASEASLGEDGRGRSAGGCRAVGDVAQRGRSPRSPLPGAGFPVRCILGGGIPC